MNCVRSGLVICLLLMFNHHHALHLYQVAGGKPFYYQDENGRVMEIRRTGLTLPPVKRSCECYCLVAGDETTIHCCIECHVTDSVCFPASAYVTSQDGRHIKMNDLKVGDTILTATNSAQIHTTQVIGFLTYHPDVIGNYKKLVVKSGVHLLLSRSHLVYTSHTNSTVQLAPRYAGDVRIGDHLLIRNNDNPEDTHLEPVTSIHEEPHKGAYVPLTSEGTLLVNNVMVSSYAAFPHDVAHSYLSPLRWFPSLAAATSPTRGDHIYVTFLKAYGDFMMPERRFRAHSNRTSDILPSGVPRADNHRQVALQPERESYDRNNIL